MLVPERLAAGAAEHVTLVTGRIHVGEGEGITSLFPLIRRLAELDAAVVERAVPKKLAAGRLHLRGVFGESRPAIDADTVVLARGLQSELAHLGDDALVRPARAADELARCEARERREGDVHDPAARAEAREPDPVPQAGEGRAEDDEGRVRRHHESPAAAGERVAEAWPRGGVLRWLRRQGCGSFRHRLRGYGRRVGASTDR